MKFKSIILSVLAGAFLFAACENKEELGMAKISVAPGEISLEQGEGSATVELTATRDWLIASQPDWVGLSISEGKGSTKPQTVSITVNANAGNDRSGDVVFTIGIAKATVVVNQKGAKGEVKKGSGTKDDPYSVAGIVEYTKALGNDVQSSESVYFKGIISEVVMSYEGSGSYGNANFYITEDGAVSDDGFYVFQTYYLGNRKWASGDTDIKAGDEVIVYGPVINYKGNTPETAGKGASYVYSLNGKTDGGNSGQEQTDYANAPAKTVAEFIAAADKNTFYKLSGTIGGSINTQYGNYDLTDDSGTIYVYGTQNLSDYASKLVNGAKVTLAAKYDYYEKGQKHEAVQAYILSIGEGSQPDAVTGTVAQTIAASDGTKVIVNEASVVALSQYGFIASDGTANVYLYFAKGETVPSVKIGDKVKFESTKSSYGGIPEFTKSTVTVLSTGGSVSYPEAKDITGSADSYSASVSEFIKMTGTLKVDGSYYNIEFDGGGSRKGSISAPVESLGAAALNGKKVTATGYFSGLTGSGVYINMVAVSVVDADPNAKYCNPSTTELNVAADATSTSFSISANAAWTLSTIGNIQLSPASGEGDATVTVSFPANSGDSAVTTEIKLVCQAAGVDRTIVLTQAGKASASNDFSSNVTWAKGANAYDDNVLNVNGVENVANMKLGTGSKFGDCTITIPAGTSSVSFYAIAWSGKPASLKATVGSESRTLDIAANSGAASTGPYNVTVTDSDHYTIDLGSPLPQSVDVKVETYKGNNNGYRAFIFGVQAK